MSENGRRYVTYGALWSVAAGMMTASFIGISTLFSWHKEAPHDGTVTMGRLDDKLQLVDYRFDQIDVKLDALHDAVSPGRIR